MSYSLRSRFDTEEVTDVLAEHQNSDASRRSHLENDCTQNERTL